MIHKPTVSKTAIKKEWKTHNAKWLENAKETKKVSVSIGKLGELLIVEEPSFEADPDSEER